MEVWVRLLGTLREKAPPGNRLELPDDATLGDLIGVLDLPAARIQALAVNGGIERDRERRLAAGDQVTVLPPVSGGA